jgi:hypothetical protein
MRRNVLGRAVAAAAALASALAATRAQAHHAGEDETVLEALMDHAADNWLLLTGLAVLTTGAVVWRRARRPKLTNEGEGNVP